MVGHVPCGLVPLLFITWYVFRGIVNSRWRKSPYIHHGKNQKKKCFPGKWVHRAVYAD